MSLYQVKLTKTIEMSCFVEADSPQEARLLGNERLTGIDEDYFIEDSRYSNSEVYELSEDEAKHFEPNFTLRGEL